MLSLATFCLGSLVRDGKLGILAALFVALNPAVILFAPYLMPYTTVALFAVIGYSIYLDAVSGERKDLKSACLALLILLTTIFLHINAFFLAVVLVPHLLFVSAKQGGKHARVFLALLVVAFGIVGYFFLETFMTRIFGSVLSFDLAQALQSLYYHFLLPIYFTAPIWVLFIVGVVVTFSDKNRTTIWSLNSSLTLLFISTFLFVFTIFQFGVSFRFYLCFVPLMTIIAVYGLLEDVTAHKSEAFFLSFLFLVLIVYLANQYQYAVIHPFGIVTPNEVYLTFIPAVAVLAGKILWKGRYNKFGLTVRKARPRIRSILLAAFVILVALILINQTSVYVVDPQVGVFVNPIGYGLEEAGNWINSNAEPGSVIGTNAWVHLGLYVNYSRIPVVPFPRYESDLTRWIYEGKIDYVVILTNLFVSNDVTWFNWYRDLMKYARPQQPPLQGTIEYYRDANFVVYKATNSFGLFPAGVTSNEYQNPESVWTLENGYIQLNITRQSLMFSTREAAKYGAVSILDFEDTSLTVNGTPSGKLGMWDSVQWFDYARNDWAEWNETSKPPQSLQYLQQQELQLAWNKEDYSLSMYNTLERGRLYCQTRWSSFSSRNDTVAVDMSIKPVEKLTRAYIPSNVTLDWSTYSRQRGNPANITIFGLGYGSSHTQNVILSDIVRSETTDEDEMRTMTYTFNITNEAYTDQWCLVELYVPDSLVDRDGDGFYNADLTSYNVNDGRWWDMARWDLDDEGSLASGVGPWADSARGTLLDGTVLSDALGYSSSYMKGIGLYDSGSRNETAKNIILRFDSDAPANFTYSNFYGVKSRLGFAIHMPGKSGEGSNQMSLRLSYSYTADTSITYEFSNSSDAHYGLEGITNPFIWLYSLSKYTPSIGLTLNKKPSFLSFTINGDFIYSNIHLGYSVPSSTQTNDQLFTNLATIGEFSFIDEDYSGVPDTFERTLIRNETILSTSLTSLVYYRYTFSQSANMITLQFEKSSIQNDFNSAPSYMIAADGRWTRVSGGVVVRSIYDNDFLIEVSDTSSTLFKLQPKAIRPSELIEEQEYNAPEETMRIKVSSGYLSPELIDQQLIYMLRRVIVYTYNLTPVEVYINSKPCEWEYDEATGFLRVTVVGHPAAEINIIFE
jgi:hypothetical protein